MDDLKITTTNHLYLFIDISAFQYFILLNRAKLYIHIRSIGDQIATAYTYSLENGANVKLNEVLRKALEYVECKYVDI